MLDRDSSRFEHALQNVCLLALSAIILPFTIILLVINFVLVNAGAKHIQASNAQGKKVLVTGVGMTKGLALARHFHLAGASVIGADFSPLSCGRVSRAITKFVVLSKPSEKSGASQYIKELIRLIRDEQIDLWVSCSGVASAVEDGEAKEAIERETGCKCIQFNVAQTETLHAKDAFISHIRKLGLVVPETRVVTERAEALEALSQLTASDQGEKQSSKSKQFILKCIGMDDSSRGDIMTLLPRPTEAATLKHLKTLNISPNNPFIIQQYISGREYCTHALVINGVVKVFCACPSSDMLMHYESLAPQSALSTAMLQFTERVAREGGVGFTGHMSFDFLVDEEEVLRAEADGTEPTLYPIECNPRAHTAVALFKDRTAGMVDAYLSLLSSDSTSIESERNGTASHADGIVYPQTTDTKYYWIGNDLVTRVLLPVWGGALGRLSYTDVVSKLQEFADHLLRWDDGTWESWDPLPVWWLYHVYWPAQFLYCLVYGVKWSRVNVSTTKMFVC